MQIDKLFMRSLVIFACAIFGAYVGDLISYVLMYYLYPQSRHSDYFSLSYIYSNKMLLAIIFEMLVYSPGLIIAWLIRRPNFFHGLTAPAMLLVYFFLVYFPGKFCRGGLDKYAIVTIAASFICVALFGLRNRMGKART